MNVETQELIERVEYSSLKSQAETLTMKLLKDIRNEKLTKRELGKIISRNSGKDFLREYLSNELGIEEDTVEKIIN